MSRVQPGNAIQILRMVERFGENKKRSYRWRVGATASMTLGGRQLDPENRPILRIADGIDGASQRLHQSLGYTQADRNPARFVCSHPKRSKDSKTWLYSPGGIPRPVSTTRIPARFSGVTSVMRDTLPPCLLYFKAFDRVLMKICLGDFVSATIEESAPNFLVTDKP